jgi:hypothetical protein
LLTLWLRSRNLLKMQTYMDTFARFRSLATLNQIETMLEGFPLLESFEKAQLGKPYS